jgi:hypothetical protein
MSQLQLESHNRRHAVTTAIDTSVTVDRVLHSSELRAHAQGSGAATLPNLKLNVAAAQRAVKLPKFDAGAKDSIASREHKASEVRLFVNFSCANKWCSF